MTNAPESQPKQVAKVVTISSLLAAFPILYGVQEYTDTRYVQRGETITLAQADDIKSQLKEASGRALENSNKLDVLLLDQARTNVWTAEDRLSRLRSDRASESDIRDAEKRVRQATDYYECLRDHGIECGRLRGI